MQEEPSHTIPQAGGAAGAAAPAGVGNTMPSFEVPRPVVTLANAVTNTEFSVTPPVDRHRITQDLRNSNEASGVMQHSQNNANLIKNMVPVAMKVAEVDFLYSAHIFEQKTNTGLRSPTILGMVFMIRAFIFTLGLFKSGKNVDFVTVSRAHYDDRVNDGAHQMPAHSFLDCAKKALERPGFAALI